MYLLRYLYYVVKHKWFVFLECCKQGLYWRGVVHDLSKFRPSEFFPYAAYFYGRHGIRKQERGTGCYINFKRAWELHYKRNKHHREHWGSQDIPEKYLKEMLCDWRAMSKVRGGDVLSWYLEHRDDMKFSSWTRARVESVLGVPVEDRYPLYDIPPQHMNCRMEIRPCS